MGGVVEVVFIAHPADFGLLAGGEHAGNGAEKPGLVIDLEEISGGEDPA